ncbi:MAG TPA: methionine ABC transporter permease [Verrucomicrobiae bacterium]|nr:methionine ABC transporter permease [Verrucomicrobiae bacterium]
MNMSWQEIAPLLWQSLDETVLMVGISVLISIGIGLPLGIILVVTRQDHIAENKLIYWVLNAVINLLRSIPFIILMVAIVPVTRAIVGTTIGTKAAIVPLVFYAAPYIGRLIESSLLEVDKGIIEAFQAMGASVWQIILRVLLPESVPSLLLGATIATVGLIGASAMAGAIGGGGLGDLAIRYGYQQFNTEVMVITVAVLVILVQGVQSLGNYLAGKLRRN